jgi:hypothetical protein
MGVDLHDGQRSAPLECAERRDRDGVVTAEHDRDRVGVEQCAHGCRDRGAVARRIRGISGHVATIDGVVGPHATDIEVVVVGEPAVAGERRAKGGGRAGGMTRLSRVVGRCVVDAEHGDLAGLREWGMWQARECDRWGRHGGMVARMGRRPAQTC